MAYPYTGSSLPLNQTRVALSTQIIILADGRPVGAVQELSINERRDVKMIDEVGTDGHIDSAPTRSSDVSGSCRRVRFDKLRIAEAFRRGFIHVHSQRIPFEIQIIDKWQGDKSNAVITTIRNVWITGINHTISAENFIITETMEWQAETIFSNFANNAGNVAIGGARGPDFALTDDQYERSADIGVTRGALDGAGLINAQHSGVSSGTDVSPDIFNI